MCIIQKRMCNSYSTSNVNPGLRERKLRKSYKSDGKLGQGSRTTTNFLFMGKCDMSSRVVEIF